MKEALQKAAEVIGRAESLAISCHVSPDGDALGSALGLAHAAIAAGKGAVVSFGTPFVVPPSLEFLDSAPLVRPKDFPEEPEVMVVFDVGSFDRLVELGSSAKRAGTLIVVDHHVTNDGFGDVQIIDGSVAASGQLAVYLLDALGWPIDEKVATCLLTAIVTDTGRFQYSSTSPETLRVAARLVEAGARPEVIGQHVYESVAFGYLKASSMVLGRAELEEDLGLVWSWIGHQDLAASGARYEDLDGLIDDIRIAREAGVAALLKEVDKGWKVSMRSRGEVDVGSIAVAHGGGGHHNAAGFTATESLEEVVESIRAHLRG
jgi:bifunctional oligoribonuclease and PAP phosphatase NrnA